MDNTGRAWPYDAPEQNDPNADVYPWVASLTGIGGTTDDYMRQYRAQQQGLERQLSELNLGGSAADPDSGAIRRTSMGGSMRMPRQPSLRDNQISSARHSIDASYAASSHSRSRHSTASSEAYSSFSEEPAITPPPKKSGGLRSLLKTVKKAFVPSSGKKSSKDGMRQPEVVKTTYRADYAKRGRPAAEDQTMVSDEDRTMVPDEDHTIIAGAAIQRVRAGNVDEHLFSQLTKVMNDARERNPDVAAYSTVVNWVSALRRFSVWLQPSNLTVASLVDDPGALNARAEQFVNERGDRRVNTPVEVLLDWRAGIDPSLFRARPYAKDKDLLEQRAAEGDGSLNRNAPELRQFSAWLRKFNRPSIASRYLTGSMDDDLQEYREKLGADRLSKLATALSDLRRLAPGGEEVRGVGARSGRPNTLMPYADDARLIEGLLNQELASLGPESTSKERKPFRVIASSRRGLSEWLRRQGKASIASRVNGNQEQTQGLK
ncbi:hypothetical protein NKH03_33910, partial [Mesorhizobium sp. M1406]